MREKGVSERCMWHAQDTWFALFVKSLTDGAARNGENSRKSRCPLWHVGCSKGPHHGCVVHLVQGEIF
jgi:hypothetical protein